MTVIAAEIENVDEEDSFELEESVDSQDRRIQVTFELDWEKNFPGCGRNLKDRISNFNYLAQTQFVPFKLPLLIFTMD